MFWFQKAAEKNDAMSEFEIGELYYNGQGVPQDYQETMKWFQKAAALDSPIAEFDIGILYEKGEGTSKNHNEALKWFKRAAMHGLAPAEYEVGDSYEKGEDVTQDYKKAMKWYLKAAVQGRVHKIRLGGFTKTDGVFKRITPKLWSGTKKQPTKISPMPRKAWANFMKTVGGLEKTI